ncbi:MAG: hypothetical protein JF616_14950 [Fibrobacteres bacterium]|nr:hypothetical protein [Fibrobacterota bacterium]
MRKSSKSTGIKGFSRALLAVCGLAATVPVFSAEPPKAFGNGTHETVLTQPGEFDRGTLMAPQWREGGGSVSGFSLLNPNRFSMHQSYAVNFASGSFGSSSAGLYLNTLTYRLADPLTLSADVGFYTPLYASSSVGLSKGGFQDPRLGSSLVFPHVSLEYKPTDNSSISLHLFNGRDAYKAYGGDPFMSPFR